MKTITKKTLEAMEVPATDMTQHQIRLRNALLTSSHWDKKPRFRELFLKGGEEITTMKKFLSVGIIAIVMIVATLFIAFSPLSHNNTQQAYAEQLAQESSQAVSNLTPSQLQALKQKLSVDTDLGELLQEAKNAKDLKTLTYDQFTSEYPQKGMLSNTGGSLPSGAPSPEVMDMHNLKFLQFTDANGDKVVLGINQSDLPIFVFGTGKDGQMFGTVGVNGKPGDIGQGQVAVSVNGSGPVILVNGKKYAVPASVTIVPGSQAPSIQTKNGDVYVNGVKAIPEQE